MLIDDLFVPEKGLKILDPFEVGNRHASGIAENVWNYEHAIVEQDVVCIGRGRAIGCLSHDPRPDPRGVAFGNLVLEGRRNQHLALELKQPLVVDRVRLAVADYRTGARLVFEQGADGEPFRVVYASLSRTPQSPSILRRRAVWPPRFPHSRIPER